MKNQRNTSILVASLYKFVQLHDLVSTKEFLNVICTKNNVMGTILIAAEGINGTIAGNKRDVEFVTEILNKDNRFKGLEIKFSNTHKQPFHRMKVRIKDEIVTIGVPDINPNKIVGEYIDPNNWNKLISDPEVTVIDIRNVYETKIGSFKDSIIPKTKSFREFPKWVKEFKKEVKNKDQKIAMFCTGGIRCEKASSLLKEEGYENVYHLKGGILKYLETVSKEESMWEGECFVFDHRVALDHELGSGSYDMCYACRMPITEQEKQNKHYLKGVSCQYCYDKTSEEKKLRFRSRQNQMDLAKKRGEKHLGSQQKK
ncbi:MAG: rhodanese-related sulfurtransferase [Pseudomonadota bacterium]|nr:rhodanese-related sulfurtransferase [Pseudomonadota bacterium]